MVSSGELKAVFARSLNVDEKRVEYPHRVLRDHDEVSKGKRGRGGAEQTPLDAAKLMTAMGAGYMHVGLIETYRQYCKIPVVDAARMVRRQVPNKPEGWLTPDEDGWVERQDGGWTFDGFDLPHLQSLPPGHSFLQALEALIKAARDGAFISALQQKYPDALLGHALRVRFLGPEPRAGIEVLLSAAGVLIYEEHATYLEPPVQRERRPLEVTVEFTQDAIYGLARLFRDPVDETAA